MKLTTQLKNAIKEAIVDAHRGAAIYVLIIGVPEHGRRAAFSSIDHAKATMKMIEAQGVRVEMEKMQLDPSDEFLQKQIEDAGGAQRKEADFEQWRRKHSGNVRGNRSEDY